MDAVNNRYAFPLGSNSGGSLMSSGVMHPHTLHVERFSGQWHHRGSGMLTRIVPSFVQVKRIRMRIAQW